MSYKRCPKGHLLTPKNIYKHVNPKRYLTRVSDWCRRCLSEYHKTMKHRDPAQYARKRAYGKKYFQLNPAQVLFHNAKKRSVVRECDFNLTIKWVREKLKIGICEVTGIPFCYEIGPFRPSIDRRDNSKGYTIKNSQMVCAIYNFAKRDFTEKDVLKMAQYLVRKKGELL